MDDIHKYAREGRCDAIKVLLSRDKSYANILEVRGEGGGREPLDRFDFMVDL